MRFQQSCIPAKLFSASLENYQEHYNCYYFQIYFARILRRIGKDRLHQKTVWSESERYSRLDSEIRVSSDPLKKARRFFGGSESSSSAFEPIYFAGCSSIFLTFTKIPPEASSVRLAQAFEQVAQSRFAGHHELRTLQ
jgi:hypothetical protein